MLRVFIILSVPERRVIGFPYVSRDMAEEARKEANIMYGVKHVIVPFVPQVEGPGLAKCGAR